MAEKVTGCCKCGRVKFHVSRDIVMAANCHCNTCKKLTGGAFSTIVAVEEDDFALTEGGSEVTVYQVSDKATKFFCSICGTPIYSEHIDMPGQVLLAVGALDDPFMVNPTLNIHCENMLAWVPKIMQMKNFDRAPGG